MNNKVSHVMRFSVITNIILAITKIVSGLFFKCNALVSDGIHSLSDLITDFVAIIGGIFANKPADEKHPYGHGKIEYLTSLIIGLVVLFIGCTLIYESFNKTFIIPNMLVIVVSIFTIISKLLLSNYIIKEGEKINNKILVASGKESRMDVISSIVVLVSIVFMQLSKYVSFLKYSDLVASIIVGLFIIYTAINIIRDNYSIIIGEQETDVAYLNKIKKEIKSIPQVLSIKSLVIMKYGHKSSLNLIIGMDGNITIKEAHKYADLIEEKIRNKNDKIEFINIHIEPYE